MKYSYLIILLIAKLVLIASSSALAQASGNVQGRIYTSEGKPAEYVSVGLKDRNKSTFSNAAGEYKLHNVKPGEYVLKVSAVGLAPEQRNITVTAGATITEDFTLAQTAEQLKEVVVRGNRNKYKVEKASSSLRIDASLQEIPQNIQIVTSAALADQQIISMSDGLIRNVSGAAKQEHWGDLYANITMRGSQIQAFRNGMNIVNSYWGPLTEDMSFVDHIEFVKGPAGFMLANGDPSGLYNVVTKKPTGNTRGEASFTFGSFDLYRAAADLDGSLSKNKKLLYRLNVAAQNKNSFRPYEYNNRYTLAPVITYQVDEKTKITAEYTLQNAKMSDVGSYYVFSTKGYATVPGEFTSLAPGLPATRINDHSAFVNLDHQISSAWKLTTQAGYFNYQQNGSSMWPWDVYADGTMTRGVGIWDAFSEMTLGQVFINGSIRTGPVQHKILSGLDMGSKNYLADWSQSLSLDSIGGEFNMYNPVYGAPNNGYPVFDRSLPLEARAVKGGGLMDQRYTGIYLQDQLGFLDDKIRLTLAGRYTKVSQSAWGGKAEKAQHFTPRFGLSVSATDQLSIYALYDQAFLPQNGLLQNGSAAQPITGNNTEVGVKKDWLGGKWNTTVSFYRILKNNEITAAPGNTNESIEIGQKRAQGIEFDLRGELFSGLNITANYAFTDAKVIKTNDGVQPAVAFVGQRIPGSNKHTVNSWLSYKVQQGGLKGLGFSGGFSYLVDRATGSFSTINPEQNLPDYFKLDGGAFWENSNLRINVNVFNVLDRYLYYGAYYSGYFSSSPGTYTWQAEAPRNYRLSIAYKF